MDKKSFNVTNEVELEEKEKYILTAQNYRVTKANHLIRHTISNLSILQIKLLAFIISRIKPHQTHFEKYSFSIAEFCDVYGLKKTGMYAYIRKSLKEISDTSIWISKMDPENPNELREKTFRWIDTIELANGNCIIQISASLEEYLLELKENFTSYPLKDIINFQSKYAAWCYEFVASYASIGYWQIPVSEIQRKLNINYPYKHLRTRVIEPALEEINKYTSYEVTYMTIKSGRKVTDIKFFIHKKLNHKIEQLPSSGNIIVGFQSE